MNEAVNAKKAAKAAREADIQRHEIVRGIMSLPAGRAWMYHWLERCHIFRTTFTGAGLSMAFQEGERSIGLTLLSDVMAAAPEQFIMMLREAQSNERSTRPEGLNGNDRGSVGDSADYDPGPDGIDDDTDGAYPAAN